jgi:arachidonate 15-lipoxygenase
MQKQSYFFTRDALAGNPADGFRLPPYQATLPPGAGFSARKFARVLFHKQQVQANATIAKIPSAVSTGRSAGAYARMLLLVPRPDAASRWEQDAEFARLRVAGANPMQIQRRTTSPSRLLAEAADRVLAANGTTLTEALDTGRLFETDYGALQDARIQEEVAKKGRTLAAPTCLFWADHTGHLVPLAIQLRPSANGANPVFTPLDDRGSWMLARAHAQAADGHYHEGVWHLLTTHLVNEAVIISTSRQLHPDHPIARLLVPHTWYNVAIDVIARGDLLSSGGPIDTAMAAGVAGVLDLARLEYAKWSFKDNVPARDLARRGVDDASVLSFYPYRDDVMELWRAIHALVRDMLAVWYRNDADVAGDYELQAWAAELADPHGGAIPGFPATIPTVDELIETVTAVIHRMSAAHAAVNNGQFDNYGFVPNSPGQVKGPLPEVLAPKNEGKKGMKTFWRSLPPPAEALAQIGMAWVLSEPTAINLYGAGTDEAFTAEASPASSAAVQAFHRRLDAISHRITDRNRTLRVPYTYLDPRNVACSTEL